MHYHDRFLTKPERSLFLLGPRGAGKSTWARRCLTGASFVDLSSPDEFRRMTVRPDALSQIVEQCERGKAIVIDEIQRAPELLGVVSSILEKQRDRIFVLIGSNVRNLRKTGANLLGGHALLRRFHPLMAAELPTSFDLDRALEFGMLPPVLLSPQPAEALASYGIASIREEVRREGMVKQLAGFSRFMQVIAASHGDVLNLDRLARECEVTRRNVEEFLEALEDLLFVIKIPAFTTGPARGEAEGSKFFYADSGVFRSVVSDSPGGRSRVASSVALEGLIAQHIRAWIDYSPGKIELSYHRHPSGTEVNFVVQGDRGFWAILLSNSESVSSTSTKGLLSFCKANPGARPLVLYRDAVSRTIGGVNCLPVQDFLRSLVPGGPLVDGIEDPIPGA